MFEILSFVFGGIFRVIPEVMKLWDKQKERAHERDMFNLQLEADKLRASLAMQTMEKQGEIQQQLAELNALIAATQAQAQPYAKTGNKWLDGLLVFAEMASTLVRPTLTYWYCVVMYGAYKAATFQLVLGAGASPESAVTQLWTPNDHAVMLSIIGFWFVDRAIRRRASGA